MGSIRGGLSKANRLLDFPPIQGIGVPCHVVLGGSETLFFGMLVVSMPVRGYCVGSDRGTVVGILGGARQPSDH